MSGYELMAELRSIEVMVQERNKEEELSAGETDFLAKVMEVLYTTAVRPFSTAYDRADL